MLAFERTGLHNPCRTIPRQRPRSATRHMRRSPGDFLLSSCYCHGAKIIAGGFALRAGPRSRKRLNHIPLSDKFRPPPSITHTTLSHMNPAAMANPGFLQGKPLSLPKQGKSSPKSCQNWPRTDSGGIGASIAVSQSSSLATSSPYKVPGRLFDSPAHKTSVRLPHRAHRIAVIRATRGAPGRSPVRDAQAPCVVCSKWRSHKSSDNQ